MRQSLAFNFGGIWYFAAFDFEIVADLPTIHIHEIAILGGIHHDITSVLTDGGVRYQFDRAIVDEMRRRHVEKYGTGPNEMKFERGRLYRPYGHYTYAVKCPTGGINYIFVGSGNVMVTANDIRDSKSLTAAFDAVHANDK